ncbi:hypothetical protein OIO90_000696 [Microbotryomycetes sp. JL221]|nr:hypothetical protein OIO90_000696 [Microbotryomycetes sp. JL221]
MASTPLKLTFKLGGHASAAPSTSGSAVASASSSNSSTPLDTTPGVTAAQYDQSQAQQQRATTASVSLKLDAMTLPKLEPLPSSDTGATADNNKSNKRPLSSVGDEIKKPPPKRKRPARRAPGEAGPGKAWRRGITGTIVAGQVDTSSLPAAVAGSAAGSTLMSRAGSVEGGPMRAASGAGAYAATLAASSKAVYGFSTSAVQDYKTPKPRKWQRAPLDIKTIGGRTIKLTSWIGAPVSLYAELRKTNPALPSATTPTPSSSAAPPGARTALPIRPTVPIKDKTSEFSQAPSPAASNAANGDDKASVADATAL